MKIICIDASNKPTRISDAEWIEEGIVYTIASTTNMGLQSGKIGLKLKEVTLSSSSFPYEYYDASRFIPIVGLILEAEKEETKEAELNLI
jgi:hypothetical protein